MKNFFTFLLLLSFLHSYSQEHKAEIKADTAHLIVKILKFNNNFIVDTNGIDTSQRHIELYDPYEKELLPVINLGQVGTPSISPVFFKRTYCKDFMFLNPYRNYIYTADNQAIIKTNNPYTKFQYMGGMKMQEEQFIDFVHAQSPNPKTDFGLKFRLFTAMNLAKPLENSSIINLNIYLHKNFKRYDVFFSIFSNKIKRIENGGIVDDQDSVFIPLPTNISYYYNHVYNNIVNNNIYLHQSYDISNSLQIRYLSKYSKYSRNFEEDPQGLFGTPLISDEQTYDSTGLRTFDNTLAIVKSGKFSASLAYTHRLQTLYYFRGFLYNLSGAFFIDDFFEAHLDKFKVKNFEFDIDAKYHFTSRYKQNYNFSAAQKYSTERLKGFKIILSEDLSRQTPDYFYIHYNGNYNNWNNENFEQIMRNSLTFQMKFDSLFVDIGANYSTVENYIYFDTLLTPLQIPTKLTVQTAWLSKSLRMKHLIFDFKVYFQKANDTNIVNLPEITAGSSLYLDLPLFKDALHLNFGIDAYYFTPFYTFSYAPQIGQFYIAKDRLTSQYPLVNFFLSGKIRTAIVVVRVDNLTTMFLPPFYYETTKHYHYNYFFFRFGVQWWFKN